MDKTENELFIAHIRESDHAVQTVLEHNQGVAKLARIAGEPYGMANLAECAGLHHDDGKNRTEFKSYLLNAIAGKKQKRGSVIHSTHGAGLIDELKNPEDATSIRTAEMIRTSIMSHHGLRDALTVDGDVTFVHAKEKIFDSYEGVKSIVYHDLGQEKNTNLFHAAVDDTRKLLEKIKKFDPKRNHYGDRSFYLGLYQRLLTSLVIDADRTDTASFMDNVPPPSRKSKEEMIQLWKRYRENAERTLAQLKMIKTPSLLDSYRDEISEACATFESQPGEILRLIVPCGAGKTISSLRFALQTAERYGKSRIFYIAPFNSILEQNAAEIAKFIGDEKAVLQHHSNIIFENRESDLEEIEEMERRYRLLTDNWLDSPIIATSAVQFLNALFGDKTSSVRRMQSLGDSIIIVDEVQAIPLKVLKLFTGAMNFLATFCNTVVVLCSATQPTLDLLQDYRLIPPRNIVSGFDKYTSVFQRVTVEDCTLGKVMDYMETSEFIFRKAESVHSLLVIVNTKEAAREIAKNLQRHVSDDPKYEVFHLSTNMCPVHRKEVIEKLREQLSDKDRIRKIICVSTTLIEAGVDVSFEAVVRSLSGLDSLVQAAGRCNRNREIEKGFVSVVHIKDEKIENVGNLREAQSIMQQVSYNIQNFPSEYSGGFFSISAMKFYYQSYYKKFSGLMEFPLTGNPEASIVGLLSNRNPGILRNPSHGLFLTQGFKSAAEEFAVIEEQGKVSVIVEYNDDALAHIQVLRNSNSISDKKKELRYLQKYTLQLTPSSDPGRESGIYRDEKLNIFFLSNSYYDQTYGVVREAVLLDM